MANPEIHTVTRIGANGSYVTGGRDLGPHRGGEGGGGGDCNCSWSQITGKPNFAAVATTGNYNDLGNKPTIPAPYDDTALAARVTALERGGGSGSGDCNCSWSQITGKPTFAPVATSGSYNDLTNKPTIPAAYNDTELRNKVNANETAIGNLQGVDLSLGNRITALENNTNLGKVTSEITVSNTVGQATNGKKYAVGTPLETILRDILTAGAPVVGDLPIFGTFTDIDTLDEVAVDNTAGEHEFYLARQYETKPAYFDVPASWTTTVYVYNAITSQWQVSRDHDTSNVTHTVDGNTVAYTRYTDNREADAGQRRMRITWTV